MQFVNAHGNMALVWQCGQSMTVADDPGGG